GPSVSMASFVMKTSKNFVTKWTRMDSVQTSYTRLHVDNQQRVTLIEDFYSMYPAIKVIRINKAGTQATVSTVVPDSMRYNLYSLIDKKNNLFIYGGKMVNDSVQAAYLCKLPANAGSFQFRKTIHTAPSSLLNDIRIDPGGRMFGLATLYFPDEIETRITRINPSNGQFIWNRKISFRTDSCQFTKLVVDQSDRFYAVGDKKAGSFFAKGYAIRLKKNGQTDGRLPAPDSACFQRVHSLVDGIIGADRELIAIGNTNDFDTTIYNSTYNRAFAVRFGSQHCEQETSRNTQEETTTATAEPTVTKLQLFPNPVQDQLRVSGLNPDEYDKLFVYNMQGAVLFQQKITTASALLDLTSFSGGVYLLVLKSSVSLKEKTIKFLVSK
ncbi:MAG TPA: T9SS type A sorting domain-containing protein, partial [Chitinophagaceae bacterium]|nr:T9SS type A sorting domain-containing protein [Chitinophagaceae bacterium]